MKGGHETTDLNPKYMLYFAIVLVVAGVFIQLGLWWMFNQFEREQALKENRPTLVEAPKPNPEPRLQINPGEDLQHMLQKENETLSTYGWLDRQKGIARIPIDRAMQLFLAKERK
jgi:hypothetical protein